MSYDLAVWEGARPKSAREAKLHFEALASAHDRAAPSPAIARYVKALLARWPDIDEDDESPWSDAPLMNNARGSMIYFGMVYSRAGEASAFAADLAQKHGLVCFDPQTEELRPTAKEKAKPAKAPDPSVSARDAARRLIEVVAPAMAPLGFAPVRKGRLFPVELARAVDDDVTVYVAWSIEAGIAKAFVGVDSKRALALLDAHVPRTPSGKRRTMFAGARHLYTAKWMPARAPEAAKKARPSWFEHAVCHESCLAKALSAIPKIVPRWAPPLLATLDSVPKLDAFYNGRARQPYAGNWDYVVPFVSAVVAVLASEKSGEPRAASIARAGERRRAPAPMAGSERVLRRRLTPTRVRGTLARRPEGQRASA
jgi:hypothetical protein